MKQNYSPIVAHTTLAIVLFGLSIVGCKSRSAAKNDSSDVKGFIIESEMPVKVMYHFGDKEILLQNDGKTTFSDDVWEKIGAVHAPFRKGLYVGQHPAYAERYTHDLLLGPNKRQPWMMKVTVKDECLKPQRVAPYITDLYKDQQFMDWYMKIRSQSQEDVFFNKVKKPNYINQSFSHFSNRCQKNKADGIDNVFSPIRDQDLIEKIWKSFDTKAFDSACANTFETYLKRPIWSDPKAVIGIVRDTKWPSRGFWYIRERECIESMESDASSVVEIFLETKEIWGTEPFSSENSVNLKNDKSAQKMALLSILFDALKVLDFSSVTNRFKEYRNNGDFGYYRISLQQEKWSKLNFHNPKLLFDASLDAVVRCASASTSEQEEFRKILEKGNGLVKANAALDMLSSPNLIALFHEIDKTCGGAPPINLTAGAISDEMGDERKYVFDPITMKLTTSIQAVQNRGETSIERNCEYVTSTKSTLFCGNSVNDRSLLFSANGGVLLLVPFESFVHYFYRTFLNE
ncbi:MAG: hypothetical protein NT027_04590 [Proteobacteria bacterium]|nr:hypothetical protein [Pseudomonadota bacterium]